MFFELVVISVAIATLLFVVYVRYQLLQVIIPVVEKDFKPTVQRRSRRLYFAYIRYDYVVTFNTKEKALAFLQGYFYDSTFSLDDDAYKEFFRIM